MTWVRLDDEAMHHPKLLKAGPEAVCLWLAGLCHCNRYFTDGRIDKAFVVGLYAPVSRRSRRLSSCLVQMGLWIDRGDHFEVHDYAVYQEEALKEFAAERARDREVKRQAARDRQRKSRANRQVSTATDTAESRVTNGALSPVTDDNGHALVTRDVTPSSRDHARPCAHGRVSRPGPARPIPDQDLEGSSRAGVVVALPDRGGHQSPPPPPPFEKVHQSSPAELGEQGAPLEASELVPNGHSRLTGRDAAILWHRVMGMPSAGIAGAAHTFEIWRKAFEAIAGACNAVEGKPKLALRVVCEWFWLAPDGPVQAGRVPRSAATPEVFAKGILRDLEAALQWWSQRKQHEQQPRETVAE